MSSGVISSTIVSSVYERSFIGMGRSGSSSGGVLCIVHKVLVSSLSFADI